MSTFKEINLLEISRNGRKIEDCSMNELRAKLYMRGIEYKDDATKKDLITLLQKK